MKNIFGNGYRISMICEQNRITEVKKLMNDVAPNSSFMEAAGESGGLVFNIPFDHVKELGNIFSLLDRKSIKGSNK